MLRKLLKFYYHGGANIFLLHRIHRSGNAANLDSLSISEESLAGALEFFIANAFEIVSIDQLFEKIIKHEDVSHSIVFTFDDGYKDNIDLAVPIFNRYKAPFTIYVTTEYTNNPEPFLWWYALKDLIDIKSELNFDGNKYSINNSKEKNEVFLYIRMRLIELGEKLSIDLFKNMIEDYDFAKFSNIIISEDDIKSLVKNPLATIASHSYRHLAFKFLTYEQIKFNIDKSISDLKFITNHPISHFAYPFGSRNELSNHSIAALEKCGFKTCVTAQRGSVYQSHRDSLNCLPRHTLHENFVFDDIYKLRRSRKVTL